MMSQRRKAAQAEALRSKRRRTLVGAIAALAVLGLFAGLTVYNNLDSQPAEDKTEDSQSEQLLADCEPVGAARADDIKYEAAPAPSQSIAPGVLTLETNCGPIVLETDPAAAPATSGIFVLQCGDPAGNGTGGPGFALPDENLPEAGENNYPVGTIAMANAGAGTGGSQFFIVYQDTTLGPNYTIFGRVIQGLDLVQKIADLGVQGGGQDGAPAQPVMIVKATYEP
jgi:peptidyl-prolyl cis-trans isomerase B (cyclophilin B)